MFAEEMASAELGRLLQILKLIDNNDSFFRDHRTDLHKENKRNVSITDANPQGRVQADGEACHLILHLLLIDVLSKSFRTGIVQFCY